MRKKWKTLAKRLLLLGPAVIVVLIIIQMVMISRFNSRVYTVAGSDDKQETYLSLNEREDSTSSWLKRGFEWKGKKIDLKAQTIDGVLLNNSSDLIDDWHLRIDITDDCFINNAWCGTMEIHQQAENGTEIVQTLDLRDYELEEIKLDHLYDGDLLIPLKKGDYMIYEPSARDSEVPIEADSELTMGVIVYYFDSLDVMEHELNYTYHRKLSYGVLFDVIIVLTVIWLIGAIIYFVSLQIYKDAEKQLEMKKSGLACMSEIYMSIYMVDLTKNTLIPVVEGEEGDEKRPKDLSAHDQMVHLFEMDATDAFRQITLDFCNLDTLAERMEDKNSIACEYVSNRFGWCSVRFFAMDRIPGRPVDRALFTVQIIDSEKKEMDAVEARVMKAERENREIGAFLQSISDEILIPLRSLLATNDHLMEQSSDPLVLSDAGRIRFEGKTLLEIINDIIDYSRVDSGAFLLKPAAFSLKTMIGNLIEFSEDLLKDSPVEFRSDISPSLPDRIIGDEYRIDRIIRIMIALSQQRTQEGSITLSVFGKENEGNVHLVFSVRDTGSSQREDRIGIRISDDILKLMGSGLHIVNSPDAGTEIYFELDTVDADHADTRKTDLQEG